MANSVVTPHFNFPFQIFGGTVEAVEQDSVEDIANCVTAIIITPDTFRTDLDDFGLPDMTFMKQPLPAESFTQEILTQEPRASILMDIDPSIIDDLIAEVTVQVTPGGGT